MLTTKRTKVRGKINPIWQITGTVAGIRVRQSSGTTRREEAERLKTQIESEIFRTEVLGARGRRTFEQALLAYLETRSPGADYISTLERLNRHFGSWDLGRITADVVQDYIMDNYQGRASGTKMKAVVIPLRAVLINAHELGWCDRPKFQTYQVQEKAPRWLTEDEARALLENAADHLKPLLIVLIHTGARLSEALNLEWDEVDLRDRRVSYVDTKNGESRGVPLNDEAFIALANLPRRHEVAFLTPKGVPYYDSGGRGGTPIKTAFRGAVRRAGLAGTGVHVHTLRHTFASWLTMRGVPSATVSELLGHKDPTMVKRYAHLSAGHLKSAVDVLIDKHTQGAVSGAKRVASRNMFSIHI